MTYSSCYTCLMVRIGDCHWSPGGSWHRFCFLLHKYNAPMDYGDGTMTQAVNIEKIFSEFFHNVKATLRRYGGEGEGHVYCCEGC